MGAMMLENLEMMTKPQVEMALARFMKISMLVPVVGQKYGFITFSVCMKLKEDLYCPSGSSGASSPLLSRRDLSSMALSTPCLALSKKWPNTARAIVVNVVTITVGALMAAPFTPDGCGSEKSSSTNLHTPKRRTMHATRLAHPKYSTGVTADSLRPARHMKMAMATSRRKQISNQSSTDVSRDQFPSWSSMKSATLKEKGSNARRGKATKSTNKKIVSSKRFLDNPC
mmetsp:Transcript_17657/g.40903  ORF Transcript_17657/g.40903 Transcript_17657/m.40903 type:complete len:228 (+) Transcript_17657:1813-2496(+)